ncbi:MAG: Flp/Fap pilin component [Candidatus Binatota bacterium]|jgi:Flp pilus assembly pilin Flp|nr:Flp/Fap pilin component [Candidatus Binatota bacterium]
MISIQRILRSQRGQGITEYIIITILIALVVLFTVNRFGGALRNKFTQAKNTTEGVNVTDVNNQTVVTQ